MRKIHVVTHTYNEIEVPFLLDNKTNKMMPCHENIKRNRCVTDFLEQYRSVVFSYVNQDRDIEDSLKQVHEPEYIQFLKKNSEELGSGEYILNHRFVPSYVENDTPVVCNTYKQACMSASAAMASAKKIAEGKYYSYGLCRPPGHHAGRSFMGGYCYFNNAVIAAKTLLQAGYKKVGILDIDYHFGNGTYDLVQDDDYIIFGSLHASAKNEYPYYSFEERKNCFLHELGSTLTEQEYLTAFANMLGHFTACEAIVVSVGYDIIRGDPHGNWNLESRIYKSIGEGLAGCHVPVCLIQEGGYSTENIIDCVKYLVNGLSGQEVR